MHFWKLFRDADTIRKPSDLNAYFKNVLDVNYKTVFSTVEKLKKMPETVPEVRAFRVEHGWTWT